MVSESFKNELQEKYQIKFNNEQLLEQALTHSSY
ncbi:MAG: ribonuclease III, partial [Lactobacillus iners]|nr:ribonuclease III [Lactobacillus iners]